MCLWVVKSTFILSFLSSGMRMPLNLPVNQFLQFRVINWQLTTNTVFSKLYSNSIINSKCLVHSQTT